MSPVQVLQRPRAAEEALDAFRLSLEDARALPLEFWVNQVCTHPGVHGHSARRR